MQVASSSTETIIAGQLGLPHWRTGVSGVRGGRPRLQGRRVREYVLERLDARGVERGTAFLTEEAERGVVCPERVFRSIGRVAAQVSVIGSGAENEPAAEEVGRLLAERGVTVVCGGHGEVMAAVARGAKAAGGTTIGILPGSSRREANEWIDHVVVTGIGHARNLAVAASGDGVIAVGGAYGTLTEIGFALILRRPVVVLEPGPQVEGVARAASAGEAVDYVLSRIGRP
jgi:uncharacterized protein (TIGR00725 family)